MSVPVRSRFTRHALALSCTTLLLSAGSTASPRGTAPALDLPVRAVTVFSDRARVTRSGEIHLDKGPQTLAMPLLPATADPSSVRVEATGARVTRVEVKTARLDEFPKNEARKILDQIDALRDDIAAVEARIATLNEETAVLEQLRPAAVLKEDDRSPPALLDPTGWHTSLQFIDTRTAAIATALAPLEAEQKDNQEKLSTLLQRANQIAAGDSAQQQLEVSAVVEGSGRRAEISLIYMVGNAVWRPAYDVRYSPGDTGVDVSYSALVAQQSGEDWTDARLTFSTAVPLTTPSLPRLAVWKIGEQERFIPTPEAGYVAATESPTPSEDQQAQVDLVPAQPPNESGLLRERLAELSHEGAERASGAAVRTRAEEARRRAYHSAAKKAAEQGQADFMDGSPPLPPPAPPPPAAAPVPMVADEAPPSVQVETSGKPAPPAETVEFTSPLGWVPPVFPGDLPASLAGGYTFTYPSARAESVSSGGEVRRVPLLSRRFPAAAFLKIQPALSRQAFLVAEVSNDGERPLLGGQAHLFVGADLVGDAIVPTTAVGQKVTLPLGVDDAVRVERNVTTVESQRGVFSKQDVSGYQVVIELLNPRAKTVRARVIDQVPLSEQKEVEITLDKTDPPAVSDKTDGTVQWELDLPSGTKKTLTFTYSVARPKNSRLTQHSTATAGEH